MNAIEIIKRLRALADPARNSSLYERKAASAKAQLLMDKHGISEKDLRDDHAGKVYVEFSEEDMDPLLRTLMEMWVRLTKEGGMSVDDLDGTLSALSRAVRRGTTDIRAEAEENRRRRTQAMQDALGEGHIDLEEEM